MDVDFEDNKTGILFLIGWSIFEMLLCVNSSLIFTYYMSFKHPLIEPYLQNQLLDFIRCEDRLQIQTLNS